MSGALRYEWRRLSTLRSTWIMGALVVAVSAVLAHLSARVAADPSLGTEPAGPGAGSATVLDPAELAVAGLTLAVVFLSVLGAQAIGQEYRYGLIRVTLTAFPRRLRILTAKVAVLALAVAAVVLVASGAGLLGGWTATWTGGGGQVGVWTAADSGVLLRAVCFGVLYALIAFALAGLTRNLPLGVVIPLLVMALVEPLLPVVTRQEWLVDVLPFVNGLTALSSQPSAWRGLGVFALWTMVLLATEAAAFQRRDA